MSQEQPMVPNASKHSEVSWNMVLTVTVRMFHNSIWD